MSTAMPRQANANSTKVSAKTGQFVGMGALNRNGAVATVTIDTRTRCRVVVKAGMHRIDAAGTPLIL